MSEEMLLFRRKLGGRVRSARKKAGLTQLDLASAIGKARSMVAQVENGYSNMTIDCLFQISEVLGVEISELLSGEKTHLGDTPKDFDDIEAKTIRPCCPFCSRELSYTKMQILKRHCQSATATTRCAGCKEEYTITPTDNEPGFYTVSKKEHQYGALFL